MGMRTKLGTMCGYTVYCTRYAYKQGGYMIVGENGEVIGKAAHPAGFFAAIVRVLGGEV